MKKLLLSAAIGVAASAVAIGGVFAADPNDVRVNLTVTSTLSFDCTDGTDPNVINIPNITGVGSQESSLSNICLVKTNNLSGYNVKLTGINPLNINPPSGTPTYGFAYNATTHANPYWQLRATSGGAGIASGTNLASKAAPSDAAGDQITAYAFANNTGTNTNPNGSYTGLITLTAANNP